MEGSCFSPEMSNNQINQRVDMGKRMSIDQPRQPKLGSFNMRSIQESINQQLSNFTHLGSYNSADRASAYADL